MPKATANPAPVIQDEFTETIPLIPEDILRQHHCLEPDTSRFTAAARLLQGRAQGAVHAYLQVSDDNAAAIRLYEKLGFQLAYRYHYRSETADVE